MHAVQDKDAGQGHFIECPDCYFAQYYSHAQRSSSTFLFHIIHQSPNWYRIVMIYCNHNNEICLAFTQFFSFKLSLAICGGYMQVHNTTFHCEAVK